MKENSPQQKKGPSDSVLDLTNQWTLQHNSLERYFLVWFLTFGILRKLRIEPTSLNGRILRFWFVVLLVLFPPLIVTAVKTEWGTSPVYLWILLSFIYGFASLTYTISRKASRNMCSLGYTVIDKTDMISQIKWDQNWFNMRLAFVAGITTSLALIAAVVVMQSNFSGAIIPTGTYFMIALLGYQIGENTWNFTLISVEAYRISLMKHKLYHLRPADTVSLQRSLHGYNQVATLNSLLNTAFLGMLALLLPQQQYLTNPILLVVLILSYFVIGLCVVMPRTSIQRMVQASKMQQMKTIQNLLNPLYDRIQNLSTSEYEQLRRLDEIHEIVQSSSESFLPFSTIGRVIGTFFLPTLTFILAVASETYLQMLLGRIFR